MAGSSNSKDSGKLAGYSKDDKKIKVIPETYTAADADEYIKEIIDDYGTKEDKSAGNPDGVVLTKWNGERATRRFIKSAMQLEDEDKVDSWMSKNFNKAWARYDVNKEGKISQGLLPIFFKTLGGDITATISLNDDDRFRTSLKDTNS